MKISPYSLAALAAVSLVPQANAFSLLGSADASQISDIGYFANGEGVRTYSQQGDVGGPRSIGGEFRCSTPVLTFGFDATFLDFFGTNGVVAVQNAIQILNDLRPASQMSAGLTEYPLRTSGVNFAAQRLHLLDLKSFTLSILLEQLGLAAPERWIWSIKQRFTINNVNNFLVFNRNFDPVSQNFSPFVNGTRYSFVIGSYTLPSGTVYYNTRKVAIDAAEPNITVSALNGVAAGEDGLDDRLLRVMRYNPGNLEGSAGGGAWGLYFSGLTRDDAGAVRYLLDPRNKNYESAPAGSAAPSGAGVISVKASGNSGGSSGSASGAWTVVDNSLTAGGGTGGTGGTTNVTTAVFQNESLRAGVDKITFVRVDLDPLTRRLARPLAVQYSEKVSTNGVSFTQRVERIIIQPDIVFSAADLGATQAVPFVYNRSVNFTQPARTAADVINNPNNALAYPGNISGNVDVTFSSIGPHYLTGDVGSHQGDSDFGFLWGSFDGTTNRPVAFPEGRVDLIQLEQAALKEK